MSVYGWVCNWDNGASNWKDSEGCRACCRVFYRSLDKAEKAAERHRSRTGHGSSTKTIKVDGRSVWAPIKK